MANTLVSAFCFGAALIGLAVASGPTKAATYDITLTPRFGEVGGTGVLSVDGSGGFNVTRLAITMANGVTFDFPDRRLDHASALINSQGDLVGLRAHDVIPGDASIVIHGLTAHFVDDHHHRANTFESIMDPPPNPSLEITPPVTLDTPPVTLDSSPPVSTPLASSPLPTTWTMMLIGLVGLSFVGYRGMKKGSNPLMAA